MPKKDFYISKEDKRKNKLEGVAVPLKDQIPKKLLRKAVKLNLGRYVIDLWNSTNSDRGEWLQKQLIDLASWDQFLVGDSEDSMGSISNLHLPIPYIVCKTYHSRFLEILKNLDIPIKARRPDAMEKEELVHAIMKYALDDWCNHYQGSIPLKDKMIWKWITEGTAIMKIRWEEIFRKYIDVKVESTTVEQRDIIDEATGEVRSISVPVLKEVEKEVMRPKFRGPIIELVNPEDFAMVGYGNDIDTSDAVIHRLYMSESELWTMVDRKLVDEKTVIEILKSKPSAIYGRLGNELKQQRMLNSGDLGNTEEINLDRWEILECYMAYDVDDSGIDSDIVLWVHTDTGKILRATYLQRINHAGLLPFAKADFYLRTGAKYGAGVPEIIKPLTQELDSMHNQRIDAGSFTNLPFGFYRANSGLTQETIRIIPGALIEVNDPTRDVYFPNLSGRVSFGIQEEGAILGWIEKLFGVSDLILGSLSGKQGATRTATGARALLSQANSNLSVYLSRLFDVWRRVLKNLLHLLQQHTPPGLGFRLTGETGDDYFVNIKDRRDIQGEFDFTMDMTPAHLDETTKRQVASEVVQAVSNPLLFQAGIVTPLHYYEALKQYLKSLGVLNVSSFIQKPTKDAIALLPEEEFQRIIRGGDVKVAFNSDHEGFLQLAQEFLQNPEPVLQSLNYTPTESIKIVELVKVQMAKHQKMLQALKEIELQQKQRQQQFINARTKDSSQ